MQTRLKHTQPIFFPSEKERGPFCLFLFFLPLKCFLSFLHSAVCPLSCLPASQRCFFHSPAPLAIPAKLSHNCPTCHVCWMCEQSLEGARQKRPFLSESDPVRRDGWKCLPLWFPGEQRRKTNGVWLPYFLKVLDVTCRYCGTRVGALTLAAWLPSCPAVCQADTMERAPEPSPLPHPHSIPAADYSTACSVALLTTQSACSHGDDPVSNWSIEVGRHRLVWLCRRWWLIACSSCGWHPWLFQDKYEIIRKKTDFLKEIEIANE